MFSDEDLKKVRAAVQAAERRTRGEIVPMVVRRSAYYREARHLAGLAVAIVAVTLLLAFQHGWGHWAGPRYYFGWVLLGGIVAYVFGHWAGSQPFGIRLFISQERMKHKVRLRAELAFYQHGLHKTQEGTGILILLSLLERRVQILADQAINDRVPPGTWDTVVYDLVEGIKHGRQTDALCAAIARCGHLMAEQYPADGKTANTDELPDDLIQE